MVDKRNEQQVRGDRARRLMEDELIVEAFAKMERQIDEAWKNSPADGERERYNAYLMYRLLQNFKGHFKTLVISGDNARKDFLRTEEQSRLKRLINGRQ